MKLTPQMAAWLAQRLPALQIPVSEAANALLIHRALQAFANGEGQDDEKPEGDDAPSEGQEAPPESEEG